MVNTSDVYLNTLCLAAWAPGPATMKIAKAVAKMFDELSPVELTMITPTNKLYVKLIKEVIDGKLDLSNRSEAQNTLMQYQDDPAFRTNKFSFDDFKSMLTPEQLPGQARIRQLYAKVKNHIVWQSNSRRLRMLITDNAKAGATDDPEKQKALLKKILEDAAEFTSIYNSQEADDDDALGPIDEIDMTDESSIKKALSQQHRKREGELIRFPWQGVSRMFGPARAAAYGTCGAFAGSSHSGKSLILQTLALGHCLYNKPPNTGGMIPVILFISLENEVSENLVQMWKMLYVNLYHKEPSDLKDDEVVGLMKQKLSEKGFHFVIIRKLGENFGFTQYSELYDSFLKKGCRIVATYLDYITLCRRESTTERDKQVNDAKAIENMVERFKDHSARNNVFFCTAFQLDAEAARIKMSGQTYAVKRFNESTLADCKGALRPLDWLFFNDIEVNHKGVSYLCFAWRKHRYVHNTEKEDKFVAYRFTPLGILFDIEGSPNFVRDIYADEDEPPEGPEQKVDIF